MTESRQPALEPERVARMRTHVMDTIREDEGTAAVARARRRSRWAMGGAAAAAVIVIGAIAVNGSPGMTGGGDSAVSSAGDAGGSSGDAALSESAGREAPDEGSSEPFTATVITTGSIALEVEDTQSAVDAIGTWAVDHGGRIDSESVSDEGGATRADVTVRVPGDQVGTLRTELNDLGSIVSVDVQRADVATQVADVEARIGSLEASIDRLRAIIADSGTTKDLLDAETQLSQRQAELESLQAQRRVLHDQTSLATISVSVTEREAANAVEPSGFIGGLTTGWNALVATANVAVTAAGVLTPWLLPLALLGFGALGLRRLAHR